MTNFGLLAIKQLIDLIVITVVLKFSSGIYMNYLAMT